MKNQTVIFLVILVLIAVTSFIFYNSPNENEKTILEYDQTKAENLGIAQIRENLENCKGSSQERSDLDGGRFQFCSYDISETNLTKLKAIENLKGNKVCDFDERDLNDECQVSDHIKPGSEIIWRLDWSGISVRKYFAYLLLAKEGNNYFVVIASDMGSTPDSGSIYILEDLNSDLVNKLKSN